MIHLSYEPMKFADGEIARFNGLAVGRVFKQPGLSDWTVWFGMVERASGLPSSGEAKGVLAALCETEEPYPMRATFRPASA
jgi:hypothetical protein